MMRERVTWGALLLLTLGGCELAFDLTVENTCARDVEIEIHRGSAAEVDPGEAWLTETIPADSTITIEDGLGEGDNAVSLLDGEQAFDVSEDEVSEDEPVKLPNSYC